MPSAAKGAVLIMSEKKTSGIKKFFDEFKAFAMRGNVLDMAVGVVVGSAFTAIVNSLVNDIISPIIGLFFNADFSDVVIQIGDEDTTLTGRYNYTVSYQYHMGNDVLPDMDEFYFNIIGPGWQDTTISNVTFTIQMPGAFDEENLGMTSGVYGLSLIHI